MKRLGKVQTRGRIVGSTFFKTGFKSVFFSSSVVNCFRSTHFVKFLCVDFSETWTSTWFPCWLVGWGFCWLIIPDSLIPVNFIFFDAKLITRSSWMFSWSFDRIGWNYPNSCLNKCTLYPSPRIFLCCWSASAFWGSCHHFQVEVLHHTEQQNATVIMVTNKSADKETRFLNYMIQRQKNGELSLYGYERKLFQGAKTWHVFHALLNIIQIWSQSSESPLRHQTRLTLFQSISMISPTMLQSLGVSLHVILAIFISIA